MTDLMGGCFPSSFISCSCLDSCPAFFVCRSWHCNLGSICCRCRSYFLYRTLWKAPECEKLWLWRQTETKETLNAKKDFLAPSHQKTRALRQWYWGSRWQSVNSMGSHQESLESVFWEAVWQIRGHNWQYRVQGNHLCSHKITFTFSGRDWHCSKQAQTGKGTW